MASCQCFSKPIRRMKFQFPNTADSSSLSRDDSGSNISTKGPQTLRVQATGDPDNSAYPSLYWVHSVPLEPMNVTLLGNRIFAGVICEVK